MAELPTQYSIVAVDIESFSARSNFQQAILRAEMYEVVKCAARCASLQWNEFLTADRGDGILMLIPPSVSPVRLAGEFITALDQCLAGRADRLTATQAMRMRVALHLGLASLGEQGWSGEAVNLACRLVDARPLRDALKGAAHAHLAFVVFDPVYQAVIRQDYRTIDAAAYLPVRFDAKQFLGSDAKQFLGSKAWITVPGYASPPGIEPAGLESAGESEPVPAGSVPGSAAEAGP
jgi:class 3 adenylate cyclase